MQNRYGPGCAVLAAAWCAALAAAAPEARPQTAAPGDTAGPLGPVAVVRPAGGPLVVVREQPESRLVAMRVAVALREPAGEAARVLAEVVRARLESGAAELGARAAVELAPAHLVFRVVGPAAEFERLAALLQRGLAAPAGTTATALDAARIQARARAAAEHDTPGPRLRSMLREALFPGLAGTRDGEGGPAPLTAGRLARWWAASARPSRVTVTVAGGVEAARVAAAFEDWPAAGGARERERDPPGPVAPRTPPPTAQVVYRAAGLGYRAHRLDPAALAVAAALLERQLARSGIPGARAEVWWSGGNRALVLFASERAEDAGSRDGRPGAPLRERLEAVMADVAGRPAAAEVLRARRRLVRDILFAARTAEGMAEVLGQMLDRTGEPLAAHRFVAALQRVDPRAVQAALRALSRTRAEAVEVAP
jgi:predicted Zn-dependent peptidase